MRSGRFPKFQKSMTWSQLSGPSACFMRGASTRTMPSEYEFRSKHNRDAGALGCLDDAAVKMLPRHRQHARAFVRSEPVFRDQTIVMASLVRDRLMGACHDALVGADRVEHAQPVFPD